MAPSHGDGLLDHEVDPTGALRVPLVRLERDRLLGNGLSQSPAGLLGPGQVRPLGGKTTLVSERREGGDPAGADSTDDVVPRDPGIVQEHFVE